jgi:ribonuclease HII
MRSGELVVGVDEAGRGSLVGDMFVAAVAVRRDRVYELLALGVRDSKSLSRERRALIAPRVLEVAEAAVVCRVTPEEIDRENLNDLEVRAVERIARQLKARGLAVGEVVVDEVAGRARDIEVAVHRYYPEARVAVVPKADRDYPVVAAASIVAKFLRDKHVELLSRVYGEIGSGYPSDPRTLEWLRRVRSSGELPSCVRRSWKTVGRVTTLTLDAFAKRRPRGS